MIQKASSQSKAKLVYTKMRPLLSSKSERAKTTLLKLLWCSLTTRMCSKGKKVIRARKFMKAYCSVKYQRLSPSKKRRSLRIALQERLRKAKIIHL